jgi:predicted nucleotidyltransferase
MAMIKLEPDFKEFLKLLNFHQVEYLLVGGYAVAHYGYPRTTNDIDIWAGVSDENAVKLCQVFIEFGFSPTSISAAKFLDPDKVYRMGVPPVCIDLLLRVSGLEFSASYAQRQVMDVDGIEINVLSLEDLKTNKHASGRYKDLNDLEHLP